MFRLVFAIAALGMGATAALACEGQSGKVVFEDKFTDDAGGWNFGGDNGLALKAPGAILTADPGDTQSTQAQNQTFNATEGDFCVEMSMPANAREVNTEIGVEFLASNYNNTWLATAQADGKVGLYKRVNGKWSTVWEVPGTSAVKTGPAEMNAVRAIVKGNTITVIVNGQTIKNVRAQIPTGELKFGFFGAHGNPSATGVDFIVRSYNVTEAK